MATIFTRIINGEIPSYKIAENEKFFAFLDISPLQKGHTLIVPKREVDYFFDLTDEEIGEMMTFAKGIASRIREVIKSRKVAIVVLGLEVPHAHIHLVPLNHEGDVDFKGPHLKLTHNDLLEIQQSLL